MKKWISVLLALAMLLCVTGVLSGCDIGGGSDKLSVVTTIFPEYDWVMQIMGARATDAEITMLLDTGVDLHNYQPTAADMIRISQCDLFIYVGGESDAWVDGALANPVNENRIVINLLEVLGDEIVREEEHVDGMEHEEDGEHGHADDEHVWLSLQNAKRICTYLAEKLCVADPDGEETYRANVTAYLEKLTLLDAEYKAAVEAGSKHTLLFGDRFPFRYFVDDYGLDYYAAFSGCSSESEASFETVAFLAGKVDELGLDVVLTIDGTNHKIAETVVSNTAAKNARILSLNSMQSITSVDVENGASYLAVMEANLDVLREALK